MCEFSLPLKIFSPWRKITQILKSRITYMLNSKGGHPLHHYLRRSSRLSNSLFNRRTTKQTFTQWPQACSSPPSGLLGHISTPVDRVQSYLTLYVLGLSRSRTHINQIIINFTLHLIFINLKHKNILLIVQSNLELF